MSHRLHRELLERLRKEGRIIEHGTRQPAGAGLQPADGRRQSAACALPASFHLPMPPSVNKLWHTVTDRQSGRPKRVLTVDARAYRRQVIEQIPRVEIPDNALLVLDLVWHLRAWTKAGKVRRWDGTNRIKFLEDCIAEALGYDDARHWRVTAQKAHTTGPAGVAVTLSLFAS